MRITVFAFLGTYFHFLILYSQVTYSYVAAAYHGNRTLSNGVMTGEVLSCSVFACTNNVDIRTCGVL